MIPQDHPVPAPGEADTAVSEVDGLKGNGTPSPSETEAGGSSQGTAPASVGPESDPPSDSGPSSSGSGVTSPTPDVRTGVAVKHTLHVQSGACEICRRYPLELTVEQAEQWLAEHRSALRDHGGEAAREAPQNDLSENHS